MPSFEATLAARVDAVIEGALAAERIVGAAVLVARHGDIIHARAAGLADREAGTPMRESVLRDLHVVGVPNAPGTWC